MDRDVLIAAIALEEGITLYARYNEVDAARILQMSPMTLKRRRRDGQISCVKTGDRKITFFGFQLIEFLLDSVQDKGAEADTWETQTTIDTKSATTGSLSNREAQTGVGRGTITQLDRQNALASAQRILKKPSKR